MRRPLPYDSSRRSPTPPPGTVSLAEAAARCGITELALRQRARRGGLPVVVYAGRVFVADDIAAALAEAYALLRQIAARARAQRAPAPDPADGGGEADEVQR